jgi:hypothetical protein
MNTTLEAIHKSVSPDFLTLHLWQENINIPLCGQCYDSSEALYNFTRDLGLPKSYLSYVLYRVLNIHGTLHCWLNNYYGDILYLIAYQYTLKTNSPPYDCGRRRSFFMKTRSRRASILIKHCLRYLNFQS